MRNPVERFLQEGGMRVCHEVRINGRVADLVGFSAYLTAVELKLKDWRSGLRQAMSYQIACTLSYLCLPFDRALRMRYKAHYFLKEGIGVLGYIHERDEVRVVLDARPSKRRLPFLEEHLLERLATRRPSSDLLTLPLAEVEDVPVYAVPLRSEEG